MNKFSFILLILFLSSCTAPTPIPTATLLPTSTLIPTPSFTEIPLPTPTPSVDPDQRVAIGSMLESPNDLTIFDTQLEFKPGMEQVAYNEICLPAYYMMDNAYRAWKGDTLRTFDEFKISIPKDGMVQAYTFGQHSTDKEMGVGEVKMVEGKKVDLSRCTLNFFPPGKGSFKNRPEGFNNAVSVISFWFKAGVNDEGVLQIDVAPMDEKLDPVGKYPYANESMSNNNLVKQYSKMTRIVSETFANMLKLKPNDYRLNGAFVLYNKEAIEKPPRVAFDRLGIYGSELKNEEAAMNEWFDLAK